MKALTTINLISGARLRKNLITYQEKTVTNELDVNVENVGSALSTLKSLKESGHLTKTIKYSKFGLKKETNGVRYHNRYKDAMKFKSRIDLIVSFTRVRKSMMNRRVFRTCLKYKDMCRFFQRSSAKKSNKQNQTNKNQNKKCKVGSESEHVISDAFTRLLCQKLSILYITD